MPCCGSTPKEANSPGPSNGDVYVGSTDKYLPVVLRSYVAVADELIARKLERYFKSSSGKAFAKKRFLTKDE
jgi:putative endonuclease